MSDAAGVPAVSAQEASNSREEGRADFARFRKEIAAHLPAERLITDPLRRRVFGGDASFYRLVPEIVVLAENEVEIAAICRVAAACATPLTFRAAGTSLSGQSVTDSVLVCLSHDGWRDYEILDGGAAIRLQPGLTGAQANARLAPRKRKIGPDPASINAAMIGGIAANNASGMCCGIDQNSYQTLRSLRIVFADGTLLDTADADSRADFRNSHGQLLGGLAALAQRTKSDAALAERIREKYRIKNTMGYSLNALIDFEDPFDILSHLMIGSEGTLGFLSEITYETVPDPAHKASALVFFPTIETACRAVAALKATPVAAAEIMDRAALRSVADQPTAPAGLKDLPEGAAALLIDARAEDPDGLSANIAKIEQALSGIATLAPVHFASDAKTYAALWGIRKGMFPSVGAMRETGTTVVIEDVAVATEKLASAVTDLQGLFAKHGYDEGIIFGHALDGNVHFVFTQDFGSESEVRRYGAFMDEVAALISGRYDGSLKAEHSTGRNMAPFVEMEWGRDAYGLMQDIKALFDPEGLLNPGVILNDDRLVHLKNLKAMPAVDPLLDKCIECGFCEVACPTRALTLTPRQRIAGLREMQRGVGSGPDAKKLRAELEKTYRYQGVGSCAGDGLCSLNCPVGIDTGAAMRAARGRKAPGYAVPVARLLAKAYGFACTGTRLGLFSLSVVRGLLGNRGFAVLMGGLRRWSFGLVPFLPASMPRAVMPLVTRQSSGERPQVVYYPSCASRTMGPGGDDWETASLPETVQELFDRAGYDLLYAPKIERLCCGMPFESKGLFAVADAKTAELRKGLEEISDGGRLPIVVDTSPCSLRLLRYGAGDLKIMDLTQAIEELLLPKLELEKLPGTVALHATCSTRRMNLEEPLRRIAEACAEKVEVPPDIQCCGFAGDKGFVMPEINESALRNLAAALPENCREGFSSSRTCEIGVSHHAGRPYRSIAYLVARAARAAAQR